MDCCICNNKKFKSISLELGGSISSDERYIQKSVAYFYCEKCGYIFSTPESRVNIDDFYQKDYQFLLESEEQEPLFIDNGLKYSEILFNIISPYITNIYGTFIDIGAGKGNFVEAVHRNIKTLEISAVEPSSAFSHLNRKTFLHGCLNSFFHSTDYEGKTFDYLSLIGVLEHVPNPYEFLEDVKKIMHDNSLLLIEVPNFINNPADIMIIDHLSKFTVNSIKNLFKAAKLELVLERSDNTVPMQFIVKKAPTESFSASYENNEASLSISFDKIREFLRSIMFIKEDFVFYGRNAFAIYILNNFPEIKKQIKAVIDDNYLYQGGLWTGTNIPIISIETFKKFPTKLPVVLAMSHVYYPNVIPKLKEYVVIKL